MLFQIGRKQLHLFLIVFNKISYKCFQFKVLEYRIENYLYFTEFETVYQNKRTNIKKNIWSLTFISN